MKYALYALVFFLLMLLAMFGALVYNPWQLVFVIFFAILTLLELYNFVKSNETDN